ncbi:PhzF family phenazine biosynthesis protein [Aestuariivirga sp.]|uniref:PhzF family phenazine biosynthesis protein n=1 Tax=Aestuariivirga sp. TaxID=2650926 RepID=UPI0039E6D88C
MNLLGARLYQAVTFAADPLSGNPAFVLAGTQGASDIALTGACDSLRADVLAVLDEMENEQPLLRFFTPQGRHPGAGHATMAAAHVFLASHHREDVTFRLTDGGSRKARRDGDMIAVEFPLMPFVKTDLAGVVEAAVGATPLETSVAPFGHVAVFKDEATIAGLAPDLDRVSALDRSALIATAPGSNGADVVIRVFAPKVGLPEDPVCGTAHRIIIPYWARKMGKAKLHSRHLSPRGGDLWCEAKGEIVTIAGKNLLVVDGTIKLSTR